MNAAEQSATGFVAKPWRVESFNGLEARAFSTYTEAVEHAEKSVGFNCYVRDMANGGFVVWPEAVAYYAMKQSADSGYNASAYRVSYSPDGSIGKARNSEPVLTMGEAMREAQRLMPCNRSVRVEYCDAGEYCAENAGKWFLKTIVK